MEKITRNIHQRGLYWYYKKRFLFGKSTRVRWGFFVRVLRGEPFEVVIFNLLRTEYVSLFLRF